MEWDKLEEVFDEELWKLIDSLIERGLDGIDANTIMDGFANLTFRGFAFSEVYDQYKDAEDKEDYKEMMKERIDIDRVDV